MLAQFYQPGNQNQATFDNMYDNINLENVIIQSNKQPKEEKMLNNNEQSEAVLQANHQVSSKGATGLIKYSSPKTKFFDNIGF